MLARLLCVTLWAQVAGFMARSGLPRRPQAPVVRRAALPPGLAPPSADDVTSFALREVERGVQQNGAPHFEPHDGLDGVVQATEVCCCAREAPSRTRRQFALRISPPTATARAAAQRGRRPLRAPPHAP